MSHDAFVSDLDAVLAEIRDLLIRKNQSYGDSALNPVRIFSKVDPQTQIRVRMDDKLSRLQRGFVYEEDDGAKEDTEKDLLGYLVLLRIAQRRQIQ